MDDIVANWCRMDRMLWFIRVNRQCSSTVPSFLFIKSYNHHHKTRLCCVAVTLLVAAVGLDGKPVRRLTAFDIDAGAIDNWRKPDDVRLDSRLNWTFWKLLTNNRYALLLLTVACWDWKSREILSSTIVDPNFRHRVVLSSTELFERTAQITIIIDPDFSGFRLN